MDEEERRISFSSEEIITGQEDAEEADVDMHRFFSCREVEYVHPVYSDGEHMVLCVHSHPADEPASDENTRCETFTTKAGKDSLMQRVVDEDASPIDWLHPHLEKILNSHLN